MSDQLNKIRDRVPIRVRSDLAGLHGVAARLGDLAERNSDDDLKNVAQWLKDTVSKAETTFAERYPLGDMDVPTPALESEPTAVWRDQVRRDLDRLSTVAACVKSLAEDMQDPEIAQVAKDLSKVLFDACNTMTVQFLVNGVTEQYRNESEAGNA